LRFSNEVSKWDVTECLEIQEESQKNLSFDEDRKPMHDLTSQIFEIIKSLCRYTTELSIDFDTLKRRVLSRGFAEKDLEDTLANYLNLNLIMREENVITLID
jgi:hypothetical protein